MLISDRFKKVAFSFLAVLFLTATCAFALGAGEVSVVPRPVQVKECEGEFLITPETTIVYKDEVREVAEYLSGLLEPAMGFKLQVKNKNRDKDVNLKSFIILGLSPQSKKPKQQPHYLLGVSPNSIIINSSTPEGVFYAVQTLRQLLPPEIESETKVDGVKWAVPCVEIEDAPRFRWRGLMLDSGRHFFPKESVMKFIDAMAMFKFNRFHFHLVEDQGWRLEVRKYPQLTEIGAWRKKSRGADYAGFAGATGPAHGGFYTQDDIREIVAYAAERFITVVPEIEMPGHSTAALASMRTLHCTGKPLRVRTQWGISQDVYCAGNDETFEFLENVLTEVVELFPGEYIHIGGDEAPKDRWRKCPKCQARIKAEGLKDEHELQSWFIRRIEKFLHAKGKKLIGWDEILEGGLPPRATVMSWRGTKGGILAARAGHDVIMTPNKYCYLNYLYYEADRQKSSWLPVLPFERVYGHEPVPEELTEPEAKHVLGIQGNVWTEFIPTYDRVEYMTYPRALAVAEVAWSKKELKDWNDFLNRSKNLLPRLGFMGVNYRKDVSEFER